VQLVLRCLVVQTELTVLGRDPAVIDGQRFHAQSVGGGRREQVHVLIAHPVAIAQRAKPSLVGTPVHTPVECGVKALLDDDPAVDGHGLDAGGRGRDCEGLRSVRHVERWVQRAQHPVSVRVRTGHLVARGNAGHIADAGVVEVTVVCEG